MAFLRNMLRLQTATTKTAMLLYALTICVLFTQALTVGPPGENPKLLVVTESAATASTHSRLLASLSDRGYELTVVPSVGAKSEDLALTSPGTAGDDYRYGGILLLCPTARTMSRKLGAEKLGTFVDRGGSLFVTGGTGHSAWLNKVVEAFGVDLDEGTGRVIDHQNVFSELDEGDRTWVTAGGRTDSVHLFGNGDGDVVFRGPGASLFADNELIRSVMWGSGSSYTGEPGKDVKKLPHESGTATVLGATLSTRVGSRFAFFGSYEALSDKVFDAAGPGHAEALTTFVCWAFGHTGVLRTQNLRYSTDRPDADSTGFRVKDDISFAIDIQAWDGNRGEWGEFAADDIQVEFVMLNPWVRTRLAHTGDGNTSTYTALIPVPDQIGIFKFKIVYHRPGVSGLEVEKIVPIRPFLHNEYRRFIPMAYPYYVTCFTMLLSVFLLGIALNYGNDVPSVARANEPVDSVHSTTVSRQSGPVNSDGRSGRQLRKRN